MYKALWALRKIFENNEPLTLEQEGFVRSFAESGNAIQAYRIHYYADHMSNASIERAVDELLDLRTVRLGIELMDLKIKYSGRDFPTETLAKIHPQATIH